MATKEEEITETQDSESPVVDGLVADRVQGRRQVGHRARLRLYHQTNDHLTLIRDRMRNTGSFIGTGGKLMANNQCRRIDVVIRTIRETIVHIVGSATQALSMGCGNNHQITIIGGQG